VATCSVASWRRSKGCAHRRFPGYGVNHKPERKRLHRSDQTSVDQTKSQFNFARGVRSRTQFNLDHASWVAQFETQNTVLFARWVPERRNSGLKMVDRGKNHWYRNRNIIFMHSPAMIHRCSIPDHHIDARRYAFFMARSVLRDIQNGVQPC
jgi:hypothetical protein